MHRDDNAGDHHECKVGLYKISDCRCSDPVQRGRTAPLDLRLQWEVHLVKREPWHVHANTTMPMTLSSTGTTTAPGCARTRIREIKRRLELD